MILCFNKAQPTTTTTTPASVVKLLSCVHLIFNKLFLFALELWQRETTEKCEKIIAFNSEPCTLSPPLIPLPSTFSTSGKTTKNKNETFFVVKRFERMIHGHQENLQFQRTVPSHENISMFRSLFERLAFYDCIVFEFTLN